MQHLTNLLQQAYSPNDFRTQAHALVDELANYLEDLNNNKIENAIAYQSPNECLAYWQNNLQQGVVANPLSFFKTIIKKNTLLHHRRYMGHQVGVVAPLTATASMVSALLNNGMGVYEMGMAANAIEKIITDILAKKIGWASNYNGLLTSGGTLANLTAMLAARAKYTKVWDEGHSKKLAVMVSAEAHYCIDRAARIMGLGNDGIIKIPVNENFQMRTDLLQAALEKATTDGFIILAIVGSCCSTSTGSFDDLEAIGTFAKQHNIWFHADGAHGGASVFSEKYKPLLKGVELADSIIIDWHKMLMVPALATSLIFKDENDAYQTFHQKAQYLWSNPDERDWQNSGKRTFECTKYMMCVKIYALIKTYGEQIFTDYVDYLFNLGKTFATIISEHKNFELAVSPQCNIVCFRYRSKKNDESNQLNSFIRNELLNEGRFYIVQTTLHDTVYLRVSLMNPLTTTTDLKELLQHIENIVKNKYEQ
jgi:L-2,4-diaminobutyrate decarboxylase